MSAIAASREQAAPALDPHPGERPGERQDGEDGVGTGRQGVGRRRSMPGRK